MDQEGVQLENEVSGLGMFVGDFVHSLDPKNRLTIPSVWRSQIGEPRSVYVLPDFHQQCLNVYPSGEMVRKLDALRQYSMSDESAREAFRVIGRASEVLTWDTQGRIRISDKLLGFAGLEDRVILIGALDRVELWSPERRPAEAAVDQEALLRAGGHISI